MFFSDLKVIFMGTPNFAVPVLESLIDTGYHISAVFTRPDKPAGRNKQLTSSPVKMAALRYDKSVEQPKSLRAIDTITKLKEYSPDLIVVAAYGLILPPEVLSLPQKGCLNVHPSLLPAYRGPSPVSFSLLAGENVTGVTIMLMDEGMDTGPIVAQRTVGIELADNTGILTNKLAVEGANLLREILPAWINGELTVQTQNNEKATYSRLIQSTDGLLNWQLTAYDLWCRIRAYTPWPGAYTYWNGKRLKIITAKYHDLSIEGNTGQVFKTHDEGTGVITGKGYLELLRVQLEGKREVFISEFIRGQRTFVGSVLG